MPSRVTTVADYLAELPADRRAVLEAVRKVILANIDNHLEEGIQYGMIGYYVPHRIYPAGYHCDPRQPLPYLGLDDLPLEVLAEALRRMPAAAYIKRYESMLSTKTPTGDSKKAGNVADLAVKPAAKSAAQSPAKTAAKTAAKPATKPAAKSAAKSAAKTAAKSQRGRRR
jgi:hypothetical protein